MAGHVDQSKPSSQEAMAVLTALYEATIRNLRSTNKRKLAIVTRSFEDKLSTAYEQLNQSAQAVSQAQSKADALQCSMRRLKYECKQHAVSEQHAVKDLQQLAARVLVLNRDANTRLDPSTAAIFARRGWNTEMGPS